MASDHEPFPDSVKDFVFDLHDAARRSFIPSEQQGLYANNFREITSKVCLCVCVGYFEILWCIGFYGALGFFCSECNGSCCNIYSLWFAHHLSSIIIIIIR